MKKNYFVKSIIFSFVLLSVIIFSCDKKNIIEDDLNICIESFSLLDSENAGKKLESNIDCQINAQEHTISLTVPHTAVLDGLKFNITPCEGTTIYPASGEAVDFEAVVEEATTEDVSEGSAEETSKKPSTQRYKKVFTVTKGDKSQDYTVYITKALASYCSISSFELKKTENDGKIFADREGVISETDNTITLNVSDAAILDEIKPTIAHTGASITSGELVSTTENSITTTTVNYTVTAADEKTTKVYKVSYIKDLSSNNKISVFSFTKDTTNNTGLKLTRSSAGARTADVTITNNTDSAAGTIAVKVSNAADVTALTPTITKHASATISPEIAAHNYADTKTYTITAEDGQTREYTVSVSKTLSNDKGITSFTLRDSENSSKSFGGTDYSAASMPVTTGDSDVTVNIAKMPHTVILTDIKPTIELSVSATVSPASEEAQNFVRGTAVVYTVTAQDGTTRRYNVIIGALSNVAEITSFKIKQEDNTDSSKVRLTSGTEVSGIISSNGSIHKIDISLDGEGDTSVNLKPEITLSPGATVSPASKAETEFTYGTAVVYTVTAEDGQTTKQYSVTVESSNSKMKSFKFKQSDNSGKKIVQDVEGAIDHSAKTVTVKVPYNTDVTALIPEMVLYNRASVSPVATTTEQNFGSGVKYIVTAQDGKNKTEYTVNVTKEAEPKITDFTFSDTSKNLGTPVVEIKNGDQGSAGEIIVKVPHNADLTGLTPTVTTSSGATVYKGTGTEAANTPNNFDNSHSTPKEYSVVDSAGGRKVYNVRVYKEPAITEFKFEKSQNNSDGGFPDGKTYTAESSAIIQGNLLQNGTIAITVANTVNVTNLKASITGDNISASPTTIDIAFGSSPTSGSTYSKTIKVANKDLTSFEKEYTVTLTKEAAPVLSSFKITAAESKGIAAEVIGEITQPVSGNNTGTIKLKFEHKVANHSNEIDLTGLTPTIEPNNNGYTVSPTSGQEISGDISTRGNKITLTTTLGSTSEYTVTAVKGPFISSFKFGKDTSGNTGKNLGATDVEGVIDHANNTIKLELPKDVTMDTGASPNTVTLTPTIEVGGDNCTAGTSNAITSGNEYSFTPDGNTSVTYTVKNSTDTSFTKRYTVTVTKAS
ncbi:DUF5018 domain-containing protein [Ichthyobacterium seriolicida]|uniref:Pkd domain containing protein n=1 Tax=Ichthyobacterium seriolicida TaxID=242600 RepID=A0A1J1E118_9FLAO|nr:hypothetical protein [Ichthyobacterium seriolicida]BAV94637.1 pkd domain containing protein [Ichthyobacterium seriolicida]